MLSLILKENSFQLNGKDNLQTHGIAMGTKMENEILRKSTYKPLVWKRFINEVFSLWEITKGEVELTLLSRQISFIHYQIYG